MRSLISDHQGVEINIISSDGPEFLSELLEMTQVFIFNPSKKYFSNFRHLFKFTADETAPCDTEHKHFGHGQVLTTRLSLLKRSEFCTVIDPSGALNISTHTVNDGPLTYFLTSMLMLALLVCVCVGGCPESLSYN